MPDVEAMAAGQNPRSGALPDAITVLQEVAPPFIPAGAHELEGEPERVLRAGEAFWEPGGDVIHYQDGNNRDDRPMRFTVTMLCEPGRPMLTFVDEEELARRGRT